MDKTDIQLVEASLDGDDVSFDILVKRYTRQIYSFVYRLTGAGHDTEDIVQTVFFKVWKKLKSYDHGQSFKNWIFSIARNTSIDWLRKKKSLTFSSLENDETGEYIEQSIPDTEPLPEELFARKETAALLEGVLAKLNLDYRTVLLLHYVDSYTFQEIADVTGKPMNTVKSQHRRALLALRSLIEAENAPFNGLKRNND